MRRVSFSQIDMWQRCQQKYKYRYIDDIKVEPNPMGRLGVGRKFSERIEIALLAHDLIPAEKQILALMGVDLEEEKGLVKILQQVPDWIWQIQKPVSEEKLVVNYCLECGTVADDQCGPFTHAFQTEHIELVGMPDAWYIQTDAQGEAEAIIVLEFKTTGDPPSKAKAKLRNYELWSMQPIYYAVMLYDKYEWLRRIPFYKQHILFSSNGKGFVLEGSQKPVTKKIMKQARQEMLDSANQVGKGDIVHTFGPMCEFCDYKEKCELWMMGLDSDNEGLV